MIKAAFFRINFLLILFLVLILLSIPVSSNQAQVSIFNAGIQLGVAKARFQLFGQNTMERFTLRDLGWAREAIVTAERDMAQFTTLCDTRIELVLRIIRKIDDYSRLSRNMNANARRAYINNIFESYRSAIQITLGTARLDTCRSQPNCDGKIALTGYKFGQALFASSVQGNRVRSFQIGRISEMKDAIREGIWMSMDRVNQGERGTGINKLCCSFGDKDEWHRFMNSLGRSTTQEAFRNLMNDIRGTIRRAVVTAADCQPGRNREDNRRDDNRRDDQRRDDNRQEENLVRGLLRINCGYSVFVTSSNTFYAKFRSNGSMEIFRTHGTRRVGSETGRWSYNTQTNILSFSGTSYGSYSGTIQQLPNNRNGFRIVGTSTQVGYINFSVVPRVLPD